jgi:hypothetical protein
MNLQENISRIKDMMGLISEQTIKLPHVISDSFNSTDADSAHKLTKMEADIDKVLPQIYSQGINPKMYNVSMSITNNKGYFTTTYSITIAESDDGKAWTGFASRGSISNDYESRADGQISGSENQDGKSLAQKLKSIGALEIIPINPSPIVDRKVPFKQYFFQFTKQKYPSLPSNKNKVPSTQTNQNITTTSQKLVVKGKDLNELREKLKQQTQNISIDTDSITVDMKNYTVSFDKGNEQVKVVSLIFDDQGQLDSRLHTIRQKNPTMELMESGKIGNIDWVILVIR